MPNRKEATFSAILTSIPSYVVITRWCYALDARCSATAFDLWQCDRCLYVCLTPVTSVIGHPAILYMVFSFSTCQTLFQIPLFSISRSSSIPQMCQYTFSCRSTAVCTLVHHSCRSHSSSHFVICYLLMSSNTQSSSITPSLKFQQLIFLL